MQSDMHTDEDSHSFIHSFITENFRLNQYVSKSDSL